MYDIESYPNIFTLCAVYANGKGIRVFEVSDRKNKTQKLVGVVAQCICKQNHKMLPQLMSGTITILSTELLT